MGNEPIPSPLEVMERERAKHLKLAAEHSAKAAELDRDIADYNRLNKTYGFVMAAPPEAAPPPAAAANSIELLSDLIERYRTDDRSPFKNLRYASRKHYEHLMERIESEHGHLKLADLRKESDLDAIYKGWAAEGKLRNAHALITMLRGVNSFGVSVLDDERCKLIGMLLHNMRFPITPPRSTPLTREHVELIIAKAKEKGIDRGSIALAQAIQFEFKLRQKDVIGEWVPTSEPGVSEILHPKGRKWLRGLRWENLDANCVMRHPSSINGEILELPFGNSGLVMRELSRYKRQPRGALVISEFSKLPWVDEEYRRQWRKIADACGIPKTVKNMDSRSNKEARRSERQKMIRPMSADDALTGR
jgi:hypothetical protein